MPSDRVTKGIELIKEFESLFPGHRIWVTLHGVPINELEGFEFNVAGKRKDREFKSVLIPLNGTSNEITIFPEVEL